MDFYKSIHGIRFGKFTIKSIPEAEINMHAVPLTLTSRTATKPDPLKAPETWKQWQCLGNSLPLNIPLKSLIPSPPLNSYGLVCLSNYYHPLEVRFCLLSYCSMWDLEFCPAIPHISDYHQPSKLLAARQVNFKSKCKSPQRQVGSEDQQGSGETNYCCAAAHCLDIACPGAG